MLTPTPKFAWHIAAKPCQPTSSVHFSLVLMSYLFFVFRFNIRVCSSFVGYAFAFYDHIIHV